MLAIDPRKSMSYETFLERVDELIDQVLSSPTEPGVDRIYTPGQRSFLLAEQRERDGIPLAPATIVKLREVGSALGVDWPGARD
jgi:LDH2 family malate/lactate/ureidoglycolate dehydrogenase